MAPTKLHKTVKRVEALQFVYKCSIIDWEATKKGFEAQLEIKITGEWNEDTKWIVKRRMMKEDSFKGIELDRSDNFTVYFS